MTLHDRGMRRREFHRIKEAMLYHSHIDIPGFSGIAGVLNITETAGSWQIDSIGGYVTLAAPGYRWLQLCPDAENWWLTVMYDTEDKLVQYYFDITGGSYISEEGEPRFIDMYLDIVMGPDGSYEILDMNELHDALDAGDVTEKQYEDALNTADMLIGEIAGKERFWRRLCADILDKLKRAAE